MRTIPAIPEDINYVIPWITDETDCLIWAGPQVHFPLEPERLLEEIEFSYNNSFCFKPVGAIKAFGQLLSKQRDMLHMARIIVAPENRGKGYGRQICTDLIQIGRERNARALTLNAYRENLVGIRLYRGLGFFDDQEKSTPEYLHMIKNLT